MATTTRGAQALADIGFEKTGRWALVGDQLRAQLETHRGARDVLYAFVSGDEVLYIGKTANTLWQRMGQYEQPGPTQKTNIRNNAAIKELLKAGGDVGILVFTEPELTFFRGIPVNLAAGLEDELIRRFRPRWNKLGKGRSTVAETDGTPITTPSPMNKSTTGEREWFTVLRRLKTGTNVRNWSKHSGYLEDSFTIVAVSDDAIEVDSPGAKHIQRIHRREFEKVLAIWDAYLGMKVQRSELRDLTRFSTYIISIIHHVTK